MSSAGRRPCGLQTDAGFHRWLVEDPAFVAGNYDTGVIEDRWGGGPSLEPHERALAAIAASAARATEPQRRPTPVATSGSAWGELARHEALRT